MILQRRKNRKYEGILLQGLYRR
jgi:hypothetical protein